MEGLDRCLHSTYTHIFSIVIYPLTLLAMRPIIVNLYIRSTYTINKDYVSSSFSAYLLGK